MKTTTQMAREAGFTPSRQEPLFVEMLERFAELIRADERNSWPAEMEAMERQVNILTDALAQEREACAVLAEKDDHYILATTIRARGEHMICDECETVAHCMKNGCVPKDEHYKEVIKTVQELFDAKRKQQPAPLLDLDSSTGFTFSVEHGTFIGEVEMLKWLVENRSKDYWEHVAKEGTRK